jgi:pimeloyl-ACP methyl ester carboxylesterase
VGRLELPPSRWVDVDGPVHYREWPGPEDGPVFVCVHGLGGSLLNWALVAPGLAQRGRVLALDLAGFGLTAPGHRGTDVHANQRLLGGFLRALDLPPAVLVGNSMGGKITLLQAARAPGEVRALILVDAALPRARDPRALPSARVAATFTLYASRRLGQWFLRNRSRRLGAAGLVRETLRVCAADPSSVSPMLVQELVEMVGRRESFEYAHHAFLDAARSIVRAQVSPRPYRALVQGVRAPALVMHGALDRLIPLAAAAEAAAQHPQWELVVFTDLGHIPMMEAPARWLSAVEGWLDRMSFAATSRPPSPAARASPP